MNNMNILQKIREFGKSILASVSMMIAKFLLGKELFEQEYRNNFGRKYDELTPKNDVKEKTSDTKEDFQKNTQFQNMTIDIENLIQAGKSFSDKLTNQDMVFFAELSEFLNQNCEQIGCKNISLIISSVNSTKTEFNLTVRLETEEGEKNIQFDKNGVIFEPLEENLDLEKSITNYVKRFCLEQNVQTLPKMKDFAEKLYDEAQYNIIVGKDESVLQFFQEEINIRCNSQTNQLVTVLYNDKELFQGNLISLGNEHVAKEIAKEIYKGYVSEIGIQIDEDKNMDSSIQFEDLNDYFEETVGHSDIALDNMTNEERDFDEDVEFFNDEYWKDDYYDEFDH